MKTIQLTQEQIDYIIELLLCKKFPASNVLANNIKAQAEAQQ